MLDLQSIVKASFAKMAAFFFNPKKKNMKKRNEKDKEGKCCVAQVTYIPKMNYTYGGLPEQPQSFCHTFTPLVPM